jgi:hypothetical protein
LITECTNKLWKEVSQEEAPQKARKRWEDKVLKDAAKLLNTNAQ